MPAIGWRFAGSRSKRAPVPAVSPRPDPAPRGHARRPRRSCPHPAVRLAARIGGLPSRRPHLERATPLGAGGLRSASWAPPHHAATPCARRVGTEPSLSSRRLWPRDAPQWRSRATSPNRLAPTVTDVSRRVASPAPAGPRSTYVRPRAHDDRDGARGARCPCGSPRPRCRRRRGAESIDPALLTSELLHRFERAGARIDRILRKRWYSGRACGC